MVVLEGAMSARRVPDRVGPCGWVGPSGWAGPSGCAGPPCSTGSWSSSVIRVFTGVCETGWMRRGRLLGLRVILLAVAGASVAGALVVQVVGGGTVSAGSPVSTPPAASVAGAAPRLPLRVPSPLAARPVRPVLAVVGASFAAGVGAGHHAAGWPEDLAGMLHWGLRVSADPGAGYVSSGVGGRGPFAQLTRRLGLARLDPAVVLVQGGHNDLGEPLPLVRQRVESLVLAIRRESPRARVGVVTVFWTGPRPSSAAMALDRAIVDAARRADQGVMVFDPLAERWRYPRVGDHLHPSAAGHRWIAARLVAGLRGYGIVAAAPGGSPGSADSAAPGRRKA